MSSLAKNTKTTVIPCLRYRNAPAAIEWLCQAFGFEKHLIVPGEGGTIAHESSLRKQKIFYRVYLNPRLTRRMRKVIR